MYKKRLFYIITALLCCFTACNNGDQEADAYGVFEATEIIISSENNGKLLEFNVQEGHTYEKGTKLGYIDTFQLYLQIQQLDASIKATLARRPDMPSQVRALQDKLSTLEKEEMRVKNLVNANAASTKDLDDLTAEINITKSQILATKSTLNITSQSIMEEVEAMYFQKLQLENALSKCHLRAPITGTVLKKYIEVNELAFQGKPLYKIADLSNMYIQVYVTEDQLAALKHGQKVKVSVDASKGSKYFDGQITWISSKAEFTPKMIQTKKERVNLVYAVKVGFKNDGSAKIGMPGDVKFE
ncbi:MAG: efflux RND transporter periplasmic adaptor subunit [Bacteroidales bacterium]|jgi:HlyD family secretion protein|nr:efflux RND transporter periplasmic adaptor subunit [Bacteroidales bacterium]